MGGSYMMEYSDDGFRTKERKTYSSQKEIYDVIERKLPSSELEKFILKDKQILIS